MRIQDDHGVWRRACSHCRGRLLLRSACSWCLGVGWREDEQRPSDQRRAVG